MLDAQANRQLKSFTSATHRNFGTRLVLSELAVFWARHFSGRKAPVGWLGIVAAVAPTGREVPKERWLPLAEAIFDACIRGVASPGQLVSVETPHYRATVQFNPESPQSQLEVRDKRLPDPEVIRLLDAILNGIILAKLLEIMPLLVQLEAANKPPVMQNPSTISQAKLATEYHAAHDKLLKERKDLLQSANEYLAPRFWARIQQRLQNNSPSDRDDKDRFADELNAELDQLGLGVLCPLTGLVAYFRVTGRGDFQLIPHGHKHHSISRMDMSEFFKDLTENNPIQFALAISSKAARATRPETNQAGSARY